MRPTVDQLRGLGDFATTYQWDMQFIEGAPFNLDDALNLRCSTAEAPKVTNEPIDIRIRGEHIRQPGITDPEHTLTLNFLETVDNVVSSSILAWRTACKDTLTGNQQKSNDVKIHILLNRMDRQDNIIWSYLLRGCFLETYDPLGGELNSESGLVSPSMTISYDYFLEGPVSSLI